MSLISGGDFFVFCKLQWKNDYSPQGYILVKAFCFTEDNALKKNKEESYQHEIRLLFSSGILLIVFLSIFFVISSQHYFRFLKHVVTQVTVCGEPFHQPQWNQMFYFPGETESLFSSNASLVIEFYTASQGTVTFSCFLKKYSS